MTGRPKTRHLDPDRAALLSLLESALTSPHGISVRSPDIEHLRRKLTFLRVDLRKEGVLKYDTLSFRGNPKDLRDLLILHKEQVDGPKSTS